MKSKMKTTFALIAVALMVLVAVVPMIGVFTSDSDATIAKDPTTDTNLITVKVTLYDLTGTAITSSADGNLVKITFGAYSFTQAVSANIQFSLYEASIPNAAVSYVDKDGVAIDGFSVATLSDMTNGNTYSVTLKETNLATRTVPILFKNGTATAAATSPYALTAVTNAFTADMFSISYLGYKVFDSNGDNKKEIGSGQFVITKADVGTTKDVYFGTFAFDYNAVAPSGNVFVQIQSGFTTSPSNSGLTFDTEALIQIKKNVTSSADAVQAIKADVDLVTVKALEIFGSQAVNASKVTETVGAESTDLTPMNSKQTMVYGVSDAYFFGTLATTGTPTYKVTLSVGSNTSSETLAVATGGITLDSGKTFGGTIKMGTSSEIGTYATTVVKADTDPAETMSVSVTTDKDGKFFTIMSGVGKTADGSIAKGTFTVGSVTFEVPSGNYAKTSIALAISTADAGYELVTGQLQYNGANVKDVEILVSGSPTFGSTVTTDVAAGSVNYSFYAVKDSVITLSIAGAAVSGQTSQMVGKNSTGTANILTIGSQKVSIKLQDAIGNPINTDPNNVLLKSSAADDAVVMATFAPKANTETGVFEATLRADIPVSGTYVYFENGAINSAYVKDSVYKTDYATFTLQVLKADGSEIYDGTPANVVTLYVASAYKTTAGTIIYDYSTAKQITPVAASKSYTFEEKLVVMQKSYESLSATPINVMLAIPSANITGANIFKATNILTAFDDGDVVLMASADSLSGKLTKLDGETPLAGATVTLMLDKGAAADEVVYTTTTSSESGHEGEFTVYSDKKLVSGAIAENVNYLKFEKTGYTFTAENQLKANNKTYASTADYYIAAVTDTDGEPVYTGTLTVAGVEFKANKALKAFTGTVALTAGTEVAITLTNRTIDKFTPDETDVSTGVLSFVTNESVYPFVLADAAGNAIKIAEGAGFKVYKSTGTEYDNGTAIVPAVDETGYIGSVVLKDLEYPYTAYYISASQNADDDKYAFSDTNKVLLGDEDEPAVIKSSSKMFLIPLVDYDGEALTVTTAPTEKDGKLDISVVMGTMKFLGVASTTYTIDLTNAKVIDPTGEEVNANIYFPATTGDKSYYTLKPGDGVLVAPNELYTFEVVDGAGRPIYAEAGEVPAPVYNDIKVRGYVSVAEYVTLSNTAVATDKDGMINIVGPGDDYFAFEIVSEKLSDAGYTFQFAVESYIFAANETVIDVASDVSFYSMQGKVTGDYRPTVFTVSAYDEEGNLLDEAAQNGKLIIDLEAVEVFALEVTTVATNGYFAAGGIYLSDSLMFLSPFVKITGSLPVAAVSSADYVSVDLWSEGLVVDSYVAPLAANATNYTVFIDASGEEDVTDGVDYDAITATYVREGAIYAIVTVDPTAADNPVIIEPTTIYKLVIIGSDTILEHTASSVVEKTAYLSADSMFEIVVQTTQVEGKQIVEKYTFAGWYINGKLVNTTDSSISVELTQTANTASAKYNVETYEVVAPQPEPTPEPAPADNSIDPTVLVIGICAVIVALIAVAYAVIASRPKEKKE